MNPPAQIFVTGSGHVHYAPIDNGTEYIRADLHDQEVMRLRTALEKIQVILHEDHPEESDEVEAVIGITIEALSPSAPANPGRDDKEAAQLQSLLVSKFPTFRPSYPSGLFAWATAALSAPAETNSVKPL